MQTTVKKFPITSTSVTNPDENEYYENLKSDVYWLADPPPYQQQIQCSCHIKLYVHTEFKPHTFLCGVQKLKREANYLVN